MKLYATLLLITQMVIAGPQLKAHAVEYSGAAAPLAVPTVAGQVTNDKGEPLPGVVVSVIGTPQLTSTNASGNFLLSLTGVKATLQFKCQGYRDHILTVTAGSTLAIKMYSTTRVAPPTASIGQPVVEASEVAAGPQVYNHAEELPTFPGGDGAYSEYMRRNAHFPEEALAKRVSGMVFVSFVVDELGRITNAEVTRGVGFGLDEEALRLIRLMPWWNPGKIGGKPVRVSRVLPVPFVFREEK